MCSDDFRVMQPILGWEPSTISHRFYKIDELIRGLACFLYDVTRHLSG